MPRANATAVLELTSDCSLTGTGCHQREQTYMKHLSKLQRSLAADSAKKLRIGFGAIDDVLDDFFQRADLATAGMPLKRTVGLSLLLSIAHRSIDRSDDSDAGRHNANAAQVIHQ
jgi:hypothetical protein